MSKTSKAFNVTIYKDDDLYRAFVEEHPHITALSYQFDIVKLNIKEAIEVWTDVENPKILFKVKK